MGASLSIRPTAMQKYAKWAFVERLGRPPDRGAIADRGNRKFSPSLSDSGKAIPLSSFLGPPDGSTQKPRAARHRRARDEASKKGRQKWSAWRVALLGPLNRLTWKTREAYLCARRLGKKQTRCRLSSPPLADDMEANGRGRGIHTYTKLTAQNGLWQDSQSDLLIIGHESRGVWGPGEFTPKISAPTQKFPKDNPERKRAPLVAKPSPGAPRIAKLSCRDGSGQAGIRPGDRFPVI